MFKSPLDEESLYQKYDRFRVYDSIVDLKNQVRQAWVEGETSPLNKQCHLAKNIIIAGMGGSALGGRIIRSLDQYILNLPLEVVTNYRLPNYVNQQTLVVISSYSGNTEEALSCLNDAKTRKAQIFVIATGGKLAQIARDENLDRYIFEPKFNYSNQPRLGLGYSIIAQFALLSRCKFINFTQNDIEKIADLLESQNAIYGKAVPTAKNPAKQLALKLKDSAVILFSANHLNGTAHAVKNMINENSKTFSAQFDLPELNHHLLEGLSFPVTLKKNLHFLLLSSDYYPAVIQKRLKITKQILDKHGYQSTIIKPEATDPTLQAFETLSFGSFVSFYLSLLYRVDPGPIPSVDYLKKELQ